MLLCKAACINQRTLETYIYTETELNNGFGKPVDFFLEVGKAEAGERGMAATIEPLWLGRLN